MIIALSEVLALGTAMSWAMTGILSAHPAQQLGAIGFVRWRMSIVAVFLWLVVFSSLNQPFSAINLHVLGLMTLSGAIGIFLGDTCLFAAMNRMGPRRSGVMFATHALFSALLGYVFLSERLGFKGYLGAVIAVTGVMVAVASKRETTPAKRQPHPWEAQPLTLAGIAFVLVAALSQALGTLIAKPLMVGDAAIHPLLAAAIRVSMAVIMLWGWRALGSAPTRLKQPMNRSLFLQTLISGIIGMGLGMSLLLWALKTGDVGVVSVLSSLSPILILPLLWLKTKEAPAWGAWIGATVAMLGVGLVIFRA